VAPNMMYLLTASQGRLAAAPQTGFAVMPDQPLTDRDFQLRPATRIFGQVTRGDQRQGVKDQSIYVYQYGGDAHNTPGVKLPNPTKSRIWIQPIRVHSTRTDAEGRFEVLVGAGQFDIRGPEQNEVQKFTIDTEAEREFNFHTQRPDVGTLVGRVITRSDRKPLAGAEVYGIYRHPLAGLDLKVTADASGRFAAERKRHRTVMFATNKDRSLSGVIEIGPDDDDITVEVGPNAAARGRLLDASTGAPVSNQKIVYGVKVHQGDENAPFSWHFGGSTVTDASGAFQLRNLVVGPAYDLNAEIKGDSPHDIRWRSIGVVTAKTPEKMELGDLQLKPSYRPPSLQDRIGNAFDLDGKRGTPVERFQAAVKDAKLSKQHVFVLWGDPDQQAVTQLMTLRYEDRGFRRALDPFRVLPISISANSAAARALAGQLRCDLDQLADGQFMLAIADAQGELLASSTSQEFMDDEEVDRDKVLALLGSHAPGTLDANKLLQEALARAKSENKRVILQETATWCGPCWMLSRFLDKHRDLWQRDYIWVKMDHRWKDAEKIMATYRGDASGGVPWWVIVDDQGKTLITSNTTEGDNIGFPSSPAGRAHFRNMLQQTARSLTPDQIDNLVSALEN
ncbi:MAG: thioredoxin family protein, partial [Pirellulales bacterium]|nr:thioredoxin family protein [Pirellulales bacterium]